MNRPAFWTGTSRLLSVFALLVPIGLSAGCLHDSTIDAPARTQLAPKLTPFAYFEDGKIAFIGVDTRASQYIKNQTIFPLGLGLANRGKQALRFNRESFTLETEDGKRYPLASYEEYTRDYDRGRIDVTLADTFTEALRSRFAVYNFQPFRLFPQPGSGGTVLNQVDLARMSWTQNYLYFPVPEDGIHGKQFTLLVDIEGQPDTLIVRFALK